MGTGQNEEMKRMLGPTSNCPAIERLLAGQLNNHEQAHVSQCGHCKTELALYQSFEEAAPRPDEAAAVQWIARRLAANAGPARTAAQPGSSPVGWWRRWFSIRTPAPASLALASVLVGIGIVQLNRHVETPAGIHVTETDTMRSQALDVIAPLGPIKERPSTLRWMHIAGAVTYAVRVVEVDRTTLWETSVPATSVALPDRVLSGIVPHKRLLWEVTALDARGNILASSGTKDFVLTSK